MQKGEGMGVISVDRLSHTHTHIRKCVPEHNSYYISNRVARPRLKVDKESLRFNQQVHILMKMSLQRMDMIFLRSHRIMGFKDLLVVRGFLFKHTGAGVKAELIPIHTGMWIIIMTQWRHLWGFVGRGDILIRTHVSLIIFLINLYLTLVFFSIIIFCDRANDKGGWRQACFITSRDLASQSGSTNGSMHISDALSLPHSHLLPPSPVKPQGNKLTPTMILYE